jgi:hypothetical protein
MSQLFYGSICLTDLIEKAKEKHSGFTKGQNGKIYANCSVWLNEQPDKYGNIMSAKVSPSKEKKDIEQGFYVGNFKKSDFVAQPITDSDTSSLNVEIDAPSRQNSDISTATDDLPF